MTCLCGLTRHWEVRRIAKLIGMWSQYSRCSLVWNTISFKSEGEIMKKIALAAIAVLLLTGCAIPAVRQVDLDAWVGQPVVALETHPIFLTIPVVRTRASDGTEIWNYVNGANLGQCTGSGSIYRGIIDYATYSIFSSCVQRFAACNNIFLVRDGKVAKYTPVGTGGMHCYTTEQLQPGFSGATNIR